MKKVSALLLIVISLLIFAFIQPASAAVVLFDFTGATGGPCNLYMNDPLVAVGVSGSATVDFMFSPTPPNCFMISGAQMVITPVGARKFNSFSFYTATLGVLVELIDTTTSTTVFSGFPSTNNFSSPAGEFNLIRLTVSLNDHIDDLSMNVIDIVESTGEAPVGDGRLNTRDHAAPAVVYCTPGGGIDVYRINVDSTGTLVIRSLPPAIINGLANAADNNQNTALGSEDGITLYALTSGELQINAGAYVFIFDYEDRCGPFPEDLEGDDGQASGDEEGDRGVIINRPRNDS